MASLGYARVSTTEQNADLQIRALEDAGCLKVYTDPGMVANGARLFIRFSDFAQAIVGAIGPWRRRVNICIKNNVSVPVSYWSPKLLLDWKWLHARSRS